jgi:outer membrane lipopolysaccharide assembly protein LptE/RlpB
MHRFLLSLIALTLTSCAGYQLGNSKPAHLQSVTKLYVPTFSNNTLEPRLAVLVTNTVIKQLQASGAYEIVGIDQADATLVATIDSIGRSQFRSVRSNTLRTRELLVRLRTDYKIVDPSGTKLHTGRVVGESYVVLDPNYQTSERQAFSEAAERMAVTIASEISDGW